MSRDMAAPDNLPTGELFDGLEPSELSVLRAVASVREVAAGETIFSLGARATTIYHLSSGKVALMMPIKIQGAEQEVTVQEKDGNAVIGWSALVRPYKYTLNARAITNARLVAYDREALSDIWAAHPRIHVVTLTNLAHIIGTRLTELQVMMLWHLQREAGEVQP